MTKFHFYVLVSLIFFVGAFSSDHVLSQILLGLSILSFFGACLWAWKNKEKDL